MTKMPIEELVRLLNANRLLRTEEETKTFDHTLDTLAQFPDDQLEQHLPNVLLVFDDATTHFEVMWGLVHFVEHFDVKSEVKALGSVALILLHQAPQWLTLLIGRILNDEAANQVLSEILPTLPDDDRNAVRRIQQQVLADTEGPR